MIRVSSTWLALIDVPTNLFRTGASKDIPLCIINLSTLLENDGKSV
jgi:hypothetical protein